MYRPPFLLAFLLFCGSLQAFHPHVRSLRPRGAVLSLAVHPSSPRSTSTTLWESTGQEEEVELGSKEYIQGIINRPVDVEVSERVSGDKVLGPTLRLAGGVSGVLVALVLAFLISNGIVSF